MPTLPTGTVAFLFTDIEGSTQRWERDRAAMAATVERHLALLDEAAARQRGVRFKVIGDAAQIAFETVADAVAAALDAQHALQTEAWPPTVGALPVRMAIHVGAATPRQGDYLAPCLNRLARLLAAGYGGQILLTQAAADMARESLPAGASLRDLGPHRLRDLLDVERLFQLEQRGLRRDFPPLRTLERGPSNLPVQPTPFIGRADDLSRLVPLIQGGEARLLTLTGPPGVGKTRLSLQVAAEALDDFPDGAFFVALAPVADPALVPSAIASALGLSDEPGRPLLETISAFLHDKRALLILDNFEHLLAAGPAVSQLLAAAPALVVLATSRSPLRLRGEREYGVSPMSVPARKTAASAETAIGSDAVRLFIARARDVDAGFEIDDRSAWEIADICRQLDGLPLAIELAAARVKTLPPGSLRRRLRQRLPLLTGGPRDAPDRQRALRTTIAWSHDLLSPDEQRLFRRLAVFAGGCTLDAVETVANHDRALGIDIIDGIAALIDDSLVYVHAPAAAADDGPRYDMLLTIREFAHDRLEASGELGATRQALQTFLLELVEQAGQRLRGPNQPRWLDRLEAEHDNLRAVLAPAARGGDGPLALRLAVGLWRFWLTRGHQHEGRLWLRRALAAGADAPAPLRAQARQGLGHLAIDLGDYTEAGEQFEASLTLCRAANDRAGLAESLSGLGLVALNQLRYRQAQTLLDEALGLRRQLGDDYGVALSLYYLAIVARERGDYARASGLFQESLAMWRAQGDDGRVGQTLVGLGMVRRFEGDAATARQLIEEGRSVLERIGNRFWLAIASMQLGHVARLEGDDRQAMASYLDSLERAESLGANEMMVENIEFLACVGARAEPDRAVRLFGAAVALRVGFALPPPMVSEAAALEAHLAEAKRAAGDWTSAWAAGQALTLEQAVAEARALAPGGSALA